MTGAPDDIMRLALLVPSSNTVMEGDLHGALPRDRIAVHTGRMYLVETTPEAERRMIEEHAAKAAEDLGTVEPHLLVFGCTSAGSLGGLEYDRGICEDLGRRAGCPAIGVINAVSGALGRLGLRRVALITPYVPALTDAVRRSLEEGGVEVVAAHGLGLSVNIELAAPTPDDIVDFARDRLAGVDFDGLFASCTNFRALDAKPLLEEAFGCPVVTSNSAVIEAIRERLP